MKNTKVEKFMKEINNTYKEIYGRFIEDQQKNLPDHEFLDKIKKLFITFIK